MLDGKQKYFAQMLDRQKSQFNSSLGSNFQFFIPRDDVRSSQTFAFLFKRLFDVVVSSLVLSIVALPLLSIAISIKIDSPGSAFYRQTRIGLKGRRFEVLKLRTMVHNAEHIQMSLESQNEIEGGVLFKIKQDPRITRIGKFLRRYSIDEFPQLINVLKGDMSLVGPRPLTLRDVSKLPEEQSIRTEVLPGITGLWQVSGRSHTSSEQLGECDLSYIQRWSIFLDLTILLKTFQVVIAGDGAY